nr:putative ribonuclease H-like domain-containing protein [Tanacetum cinerariifolium]
MFDLDYLTNSMNYKPVSVKNQANKFTGPKEANNNAGTQSNDDQGANSKEIDLNEEHFILPIYSSYSNIVKSSGDKIEKNTGFKTCEKPNASTSSTNLINTASTPLNIVGPSRAFIDGELSYHDPSKYAFLDDPSMPHLEDIYASPSEGIFTDSSYDDEGVVTDFNNSETTMSVSPTPTTRIHTIHPKTQILGDPKSAVQTRTKVNKNSKAHALKAIRTKWVYRNKKDERGVVVRNTARLVTQGHRQEEGIDYDEVFALVASIEAIRIFLAFASYMGFIVYQIDVKSAFLYGTIGEEVYVSQPPGFVDPKFPNKVYKVVKALYGLHQTPRACVKTASTPIETQKPLVKDKEAANVDVHLYRSMIGSLMYLTASRPDIMFAVCAYSRFQVTLKTLHLHVVKRIFRYLKGQPKLGLWYPKVSSFDLEAYSDSDYAGANLDRKSTTRCCQFLGRRLISWQCKKQTIMATSTTEVEYVAAAHYCGQVLWIQNQLLDYGFNFMNTKIYIDNESIICIVKNLIFYSKKKYIEIRHHFIKDAYEQKLIQVLKIHTDDNVADLLTTAFDVSSKELASPKQMALGKDISNLLMAGRLPETILPTRDVDPHEFIHRLSAKTTSWNEFSTTMASAIICLATNQKFNFSRYILLSLVKNIEDIYDNPSLTKKVFAIIKRVGTSFSGIVTPLFDNMLVPTAKEVGLIQDDVQLISIPTKPFTSKPQHKPKKQQTQAPKVPFPKPSPKHKLPLPSNDPLSGGKDSLKLKELMDLCIHLSNKVLELESEVIYIKSTYKERIEKLEGRVNRLKEENMVLKELHSVHSKVDTAAPVMEKEKSFKQGRIITDIDEDVEINLEEAHAKPYRMDLEHPEEVLSMQDVDDEEPAKVEEVIEVVTTAKLIIEVITSARATTTGKATKVSVPRRRRGVVIPDPEETTSTVVVHSEVQSKDKGKGMTYSEIRPFFKKHYNYNQAFLKEVNKEVTVPEKEVKVEGHKREGESLEKEITKKQMIDEEAEELKSHLQIVSNDDDDVYIEATPLASKIPIVDYKIHLERNKPYFKIIKADGNNMLFLSFTSVWRDQKGRYVLAKRYPLTHFTLEQMLNNVRLEVEEESEMSLELL